MSKKGEDSNDDNSSKRINAKDIYKEMLDGRKFELEHLWQRSVFLGAFMLAIAAAYGAIIMSMYFSDDTKQFVVYGLSQEAKDALKTLQNGIQYSLEGNILLKSVVTPDNFFQHGIAAGVCWLGIIFSMLWIMMAKGSKFWSSRYEAAIMWFENDYHYYDDIYDTEMPCYGSMPELKSYSMTENLFSTLSGNYSMSRINIMIGIVAIIVWGFLNMVHFGTFLKLQKAIRLDNFQCALFSIVELFGLGMLVYAVLNMLCKSES